MLVIYVVVVVDVIAAIVSSYHESDTVLTLILPLTPMLKLPVVIVVFLRLQLSLCSCFIPIVADAFLVFERIYTSCCCSLLVICCYIATTNVVVVSVVYFVSVLHVFVSPIVSQMNNTLLMMPIMLDLLKQFVQRKGPHSMST